MRIDLLAKRYGGPGGGPDGMAVAVAYLAWTLCELGHDVRGYVGAAGPPPWTHPRIEWVVRSPLYQPDGFDADLVISTISPAWRRTSIAADVAGARSRLFYWCHHGEPPPGQGCRLLALKAEDAAIARGYASHLLLTPSSWPADRGGQRTGDAILVPGASRAKGGPVALAVAREVVDVPWYVLPGRSAAPDVAPWRALGRAEVAPGPVPPERFLARARAVLCPTRVECYGGLTLVEAATHGIPVICSDLPATRAALGDVATYLPVTAPTSEWAAALRDALDAPPRRLKLPPYREVVAAALVEMQRLAGPAPIVAAARSRIAPSPAAPRALPQRSAGIVVPARPPRAGIARPPAAPIPVRTSTAVARSGGLPRVLVLADVPNWAWAKKAHALKQHLAGRIDVTVAIGSDHATGPLIRSAEHDLYHTFEVVQVGAIPVGYPMVTGITAHVAQAWDQRRGEGTVRAWADRAIGFHANSVMLQREMERYLDRSVYYVPNGVDEKFWHRSRPRADDHLVVGHVARPNPRKGADLVREACARAGVELRTIDKSSKNALSPEQLREWYQGIHVLAVSSDMDGTPNPALEAAACECAIVSNRIGNMPEFIVSGDNGLLTERTVENLADCLAWMKGRPIEYVETMGRSARAHILTDWTWARRAVAYAEMWEKCLGISTRAAA